MDLHWQQTIDKLCLTNLCSSWFVRSMAAVQFSRTSGLLHLLKLSAPFTVQYVCMNVHVDAVVNFVHHGVKISHLNLRIVMPIYSMNHSTRINRQTVD